MGGGFFFAFGLGWAISGPYTPSNPINSMEVGMFRKGFRV